jgi:uncharacterized protein (DUF2267 family)
MTGLDTFDSSVQKSDTWLKELRDDLHLSSRHQAYSTLRVVLHVLRDRLTVEESADLGAQLPLVIKGIYYDEYKPSKMPEKIRDKDDFLTRIKDHFRDGVDPEQAARSVFKVIKHRVTEGEIKDVENMMPPELRELWEEEQR